MDLFALGEGVDLQSGRQPLPIGPARAAVSPVRNPRFRLSNGDGLTPPVRSVNAARTPRRSSEGIPARRCHVRDGGGPWCEWGRGKPSRSRRGKAPRASPPRPHVWWSRGSSALQEVGDIQVVALLLERREEPPAWEPAGTGPPRPPPRPEAATAPGSPRPLPPCSVPPTRPAAPGGTCTSPAARCELVEPRGDDRHPAFVAQGIVDHGAEDDVRLRVGRLGDRLGGPVRLVQPEVGPAGHREQEPAGALDRGLQERRGDGPRAASSARLSPDAAPIPISAEPALVNTVRTSAKSRLMRPGVMMRLVIPSTPWYRT